MMKHIIAVGAAALVLSASVASAAPGEALPAEFGGGWQASNSSTFKNVLGLAKEGSKFAAKTSKCYSKGANNFSKGKPTGISACINDPSKGTLTKYNAARAKLATKKGGTPTCGLPDPGTVINGIVFGLQAGIYCASPSGAFIDSSHLF